MSGAKRVLVVDDDPEVRDSLVDALEEHGIAAYGASDGRDALAKLRAAPHLLPAVIILDLMMPTLDGRGFRVEQLQDPALSAIPVVLASAFRDASGDAAELRVDHYLRKPIKLGELLEVVRRYCAADPVP